MKDDNYNYKNFKTEFYDLAKFPGPKAGENFIDIELHTLTGESTSIGNYLDKPLVIETGSLTCPMYLTCIPQMEKIRQEFSDINFLLVYVREAHPGEKMKKHSSLSEKTNAAHKIQGTYNDNRTILVDSIGGDFHKHYGLLPNLVYVIYPQGKVIFRGDWNNPEKLKEVLHSIDQNKIFTREHFEPAKPNPAVVIKALSKGGFIAIWDFIINIPGLLRLHKKADEKYQNDNKST